MDQSENDSCPQRKCIHDITHESDITNYLSPTFSDVKSLLNAMTASSCIIAGFRTAEFFFHTRLLYKKRIRRRIGLSSYIKIKVK